MNDFTYAWLICAGITLLMVLSQAAISQENPSGQQIISLSDNALTRNYQNGQFDDSKPYENLPRSPGGQGNNDYTDEYRVMQNWLGGSGNSVFQDVLSAPFDFLKAMKLPDFIVGILGAFWWILLGILTAMMLFNREK